MELGLSGADQKGHPDKLIKNAQLAEELGFDLFTLPDTQSLLREIYTSLAVVADNTESIELGTMVTNPVTRHPAVIASAMCTINEIAGGRANLGIATGDSAVRTLGKKPARLAEMDDTISLIQSLFCGEMVEYEDAKIELDWVDEQDIPVYWAAEGPKTQRLAGQLADVVVIGTGILPELIEQQVERVEEGRKAAGRNPDDVKIWVLARSNVDDERKTAVDELKPSLAGVAHHSLQFTMKGKGVHEEYREPLKELIENYNSDQHGQPKSTNKELVENLDLTEYLASRYGVVGTPEDCLEKLESIEQTGLVDGVFLSAPSGKKEEYISKFGTEVLPAYR